MSCEQNTEFISGTSGTTGVLRARTVVMLSIIEIVTGIPMSVLEL